MNREQQNQLKELRKAFPKICRELASDNKLKCKDYSLFAVKGDLFFDTVIYVSVNDNDECICSTRERVKPMWMDEMLWDLLEMPENKKAPVSLRAVGAFAVSGVETYSRATILNEWSIEELRTILEEYILHFKVSIEKVTMCDFIKDLDQPYHGDVRKALYYIHEGRYQEALDAVGDRAGVFNNQGIDVNESIRNFCNK